MANWYWMKEGRKHGPVDTVRLKQMAQAGQIHPADLIWRDGLPDWVPASKARGLFEAAHAPVKDSETSSFATVQRRNLSPARDVPSRQVWNDPLAGYVKAHKGLSILLAVVLFPLLPILLFYPLFIFPVVHGIHAARMKGRSPHWMWFGVHPLSGWIAFLIIRRGVRAMPYGGGTSGFAQPDAAGGLPSAPAVAMSSQPGQQLRPKAVTVLAVLAIIGAVLSLISVPFTIGMLTGATQMSEAQKLLYEDPAFRTWGIVGIPLIVLTSAAWIITAVGLWRMRQWSRKAALWLLGYGVLMSLVSFIVTYKVFWGGTLPVEVTEASPAAKSERFLIFAGSIIAAVLTLVYSLAFIVHMLKRKVIDAFEQASS